MGARRLLTRSGNDGYAKAGAKTGGDLAFSENSVINVFQKFYKKQWDLLSIMVQPLDLHLVNVGSIPTGPAHGEGRLQPHPGDVLKSTPNVWKSPRSGLNLEGRATDPQIIIII